MCTKQSRVILSKMLTHIFSMILQQLFFPINYLLAISHGEKEHLKEKNFLFILTVSLGVFSINTFFFHVKALSLLLFYNLTYLMLWILHISYSKKLSFIFAFSWNALNTILHQINFSPSWVRLHSIKTWAYAIVILSSSKEWSFSCER